MDINVISGLYNGQSCFLICDGPSFAKVDHSKFDKPGILTMGVNNAPSAVRTDLWCFVDSPRNFLPSLHKDPKILKFCPRAHSKAISAPNITFRTNTDFKRNRYLSERTVNYGGNGSDNKGGRSVLLAALKVLYVLGIKNVYLLGVDFTMKKGAENYHFKQKTSDQCIRGNNATYAQLKKRLTNLRPLLEENGFNIYNCNPDSELKAFPFVDLDDAIDAATEGIDPKTESTEGLYDRDRDPEEAKQYRREMRHATDGHVGERPAKKRRANRKNGGLKPDRPKVVKAERQIVVSGFSRAGTHATCDWICNQLTGNVQYRNDFYTQGVYDPDSPNVPERFYNLPSLPFKEGSHKEPITNLVYSYENFPDPNPRYRPRVRAEKSTYVQLIRDPFNLLASLAKHCERGHKFWFWRNCTVEGLPSVQKLKAFYDMWMTHAALADREDVVCLSYNKWVSSVEYRDELFKTLDLANRSDSSMEQVPVNGGGSSFSRREKSGADLGAQVVERWLEYKDIPWFNEFFDLYPDLVAKSNEIAGVVR